MNAYLHICIPTLNVTENFKKAVPGENILKWRLRNTTEVTTRIKITAV